MRQAVLGRCRRPRRPARRRALAGAIVAGGVVLTLGAAGRSWAAWNHPGGGTGRATSRMMQAPASWIDRTSTASSVHITWQTPPQGPEPTGYLVTREGRVICTTPPDVKTCDERNLAPATTYTYEVVACTYRWRSWPLTVQLRTLDGTGV